MPFAEWDAALETGFQLVDAQHRDLFALVNELHDAILAHNDVAVLGGVLYRLQRYTAVHFHDEEALMADGRAIPTGIAITSCMTISPGRPRRSRRSTSRGNSRWAST